jgi:hypothetical protein
MYVAKIAQYLLCRNHADASNRMVNEMEMASNPRLPNSWQCSPSATLRRFLVCLKSEVAQPIEMILLFIVYVFDLSYLAAFRLSFYEI